MCSFYQVGGKIKKKNEKYDIIVYIVIALHLRFRDYVCITRMNLEHAEFNRIKRDTKILFVRR